MQNLESQSVPEINSYETALNEKVLDESRKLNEVLESLAESWKNIPVDDDRFLDDAQKIVGGLPDKYHERAKQFINFIDDEKIKFDKINSTAPEVSSDNVSEYKELLNKITSSDDQKEVAKSATELLSRTLRAKDVAFGNRDSARYELSRIIGVGYVVGTEKDGPMEPLESLKKAKIMRDNAFLQDFENKVLRIKTLTSELAEMRLIKLQKAKTEAE